VQFDRHVGFFYSSVLTLPHLWTWLVEKYGGFSSGLLKLHSKVALGPRYLPAYGLYSVTDLEMIDRGRE
jgi:hypothetical protein